MGQRSAATVGNGAVNALFQAIDAAVIPCELEEYHVEAVTPGEDAQGQVRLRIRAGDRSSPATTRHRRDRGECAGIPGGIEQRHSRRPDRHDRWSGLGSVAMDIRPDNPSSVGREGHSRRGIQP